VYRDDTVSINWWGLTITICLCHTDCTITFGLSRCFADYQFEKSKRIGRRYSETDAIRCWGQMQGFHRSASHVWINRGKKLFCQFLFCYLILLSLLFNTFLTFLLSNLIQNIKLEDSSYYVKKNVQFYLKKRLLPCDLEKSIFFFKINFIITCPLLNHATYIWNLFY